MAGSELDAHLLDIFRNFGPVEVRRMFSGRALYRDGVIFALVMRGALYLKTDAGNAAQFMQRGLAPFSFERQGRTMTTSYHLAPAEVMEDPEAAAQWAGAAYAAALRSQAMKGSSTKAKQRKPAKTSGPATSARRKARKAAA
jgi:DNA transformation protein